LRSSWPSTGPEPSERDRVEPGKVSAYATLALRRQLERDGLDDLIDELVEVNGPLDADAVARYVGEWR